MDLKAFPVGVGRVFVVNEKFQFGTTKRTVRFSLVDQRKPGEDVDLARWGMCRVCGSDIEPLKYIRLYCIIIVCSLFP